MRGARALGVERVESPGRADEQPGRLAGPALVERDLTAQLLDLRRLQRVDGAGLGRDQQLERVVERSCVPFRTGRGEQAARPGAGLGGEHRRVLEEGGGGRDATACEGPSGRVLELLGDGLVREGRGLGAVPGAAVRVRKRVRDVRQRGVRGEPLFRRGRAVRRRAHERVTEADLRADLQQAGVGRRGRRVASDPELLGRAPDEQRLADRVRRGQLQEPARVGRELVEALPEAVLDAHRARWTEPARQFRGTHRAWELQQRERVPARLGDQPLADVIVEPAGDDRGQQRACVVVVEPGELELGQTRNPVRLTHREHHRDGLGEQAAGDEPEHLRGGLVEPLQVVDDAQQRLRLGHLRQERERGEPDEEAVRCRAGRETERDLQRLLLRCGEHVEVVQQRPVELVQPRERQLHLGLDARDLQHPEVARPGR